MLRPHCLPARRAFWIALALGLSACAGSASEYAPSERPTPAQPRWEAAAVGAHLRVLQAATGADAQRYAADQMRRYGVQPVLKDQYLLGVQAGPGTKTSPTAKIGVAGYVAGKHPTRIRELVVVCADLRAPAEAAAVLELARIYAAFARFGLVPERTLLFALWSGEAERGEAEPPAGLAAYLRNPTWSLDQVRAVLYVGLAAEREAALRPLVQPYSLRLYTVQADAPAAEDEPSRLAARALSLARRAHGVLLPETLEAAPLLPALGDTARIPTP